MMTMEELPDVITADMLRARMAQRKEAKVDSDAFEIPAELLVGIDTDEPDDELVELTDDQAGQEAQEETGTACLRG